MRKITLLFFVVIAFCWRSNAQFTESFETEIPATWTILDLASTNGWVWDDTPEGDGAQDGSAVARIESGFDAPNDDYLITPQIAVVSGLNDRLTFYTKSRSGLFSEPYEVLLSTATATAADFTVILQSESEAPEDWTKVTLDLSSYNGQSIYVAVRTTSYGNWELFVDNFVNDTFPACMEPTDLTLENISNASADFAWTENGTATAWNIEIVDVTAGEVATGAATVSGVTNPYTLSSLASNNEYELYVQADCGVEGPSIWVGPLAFTTFCDAFTAPYIQSFENAGNIPDCWTTFSDSGEEDWFFNESGPNHVGDGGDLSGSTLSNGYYAVCDASSSHGPRYLMSPFVDVSVLATPELRFYEISNAEDSDNAQLDVEIWDGSAWNLMGTYNTNTDGWELKIIDISTLTFTGPAQARFTFSEPNGGGDDDIAIDDVVFDNPIACIFPADLLVANVTATTADLSWTETGTATAWNIEIVNITAGETATGVATLSEVTNPYTITGLLPNTNYEFYVQSNCGVADGNSFWIGPVSFQTDCNALTAPYTEGFDNGGAIPDCWRMYSDSGEEDWIFQDSGLSHVGDRGVLSGSTATGGFYAAADASQDHGPRYLLSPFVDVSTLTTPALSFYEISNSEDSENAQLDVEVWDGSAWNLLATYNTNTLGWELKTLDISGLTFTGPAQARFTFSEVIAPGDVDDDIAIDDVTFGEAPDCMAPTVLFVSNTTLTTADVTWTANGIGTNWNIEVVNITAGETATGLATVFGVTNPYTLTGLEDDNHYEVYVQADCGVDGVSTWTGPYAFATAIVPPACEGIFVDGGGSHGSYSESEFSSSTILPNSAGEAVTITFTYVDIEVDTFGSGVQDGCYDYLTIYNGPDNTYPVLAQTLCGQDSSNGDNTIVADSELHVGDSFTSTDVSGALTIEFRSDPFTSLTGWEATVSCAVLGVEDVVNEATFTYYPNPVTNTLTLNAQKSIENITVYNMLGQKVLRTDPNNIASELDMSSLSIGTYFVKVTIENVTQTIRVIKQ
ncbi:putative secreted protein (Por secretion system target) [Winogradskyella pacifica]|uniref:Putative secreted protein (Por secretion system target) n=1 Tax=Winogradskyella pacifica TaxID=664642 RepID=A0A3D9LNM7_9FLAO|nr:choice-of-anchor J domain-containing protein [Winogradskyella pacifica]REE08134.1 putative secreted protein (Por secretion system target) [Winogradskyella pacifica]